MKAIILAAGRGSRLGSMTESMPKCLLSFQGKALLNWQVGALNEAGIEDITVVTGYQRAEIEKFGFKTIYNPNWHNSSILPSLLCAKEEITAPTIVSYSDIIYSSDIVRDLMSQCDDSRLCLAYDPAWYTIWKERFEDPLSDAENFRIDQKGRVLSIGGKIEDIQQVQGQYIGLFLIGPEALSAIHKLIKNNATYTQWDMTMLFKQLILEKFPIQAIPIKSFWGEIDSQKDLKVLERIKTKTMAYNT